MRQSIVSFIGGIVAFLIPMRGNENEQIVQAQLGAIDS